MTAPASQPPESAMPAGIVLIRHYGLRVIDEEEALSVLDASRTALPRKVIAVACDTLGEAVDAGDWEGHLSYHADHAADVRSTADSMANPELHYVGLAEIPHVIALGALIGDERPLVIHDYDRDARRWSWPSQGERTLTAVAVGVPEGPVVTARGSAVMRLSLSAAIADADVREVVGDEHLAHIHITLADGRPPVIGIVRSAEDVAHVRQVFRDALAALRAVRPNIDVLHLFVAAPVSVCFAVGQELKPRNSVPVQTYRYRSQTGQPAYQEALLLTVASEGVIPAPITPEEVAAIAALRHSVLPAALAEVAAVAQSQRTEGVAAFPWVASLRIPLLQRVAPFEELPALREVVALEGATLDSDGRLPDYRYDKDGRRWILGDRLLLAWRALLGTDDALARAFRLFFFHEYIHDYQVLTASTAAEVGKFGNVLEHVDFAADVFALLHEVACSLERAGLSSTDGNLKTQVGNALEDMVRAMWAFAPPPGNATWELRRLRRFLNWYWRAVQVRRAASASSVLDMLSRVPRIEIGGLRLAARGRRILAFLDRRDSTSHLELGLVLENERLMRVPDSPVTNVPALLVAFQNHDHAGIQEFFRSVFDLATAQGGALPRS